MIRRLLFAQYAPTILLHLNAMVFFSIFTTNLSMSSKNFQHKGVYSYLVFLMSFASAMIFSLEKYKINRCSAPWLRWTEIETHKLPHSSIKFNIYWHWCLGRERTKVTHLMSWMRNRVLAFCGIGNKFMRAMLTRCDLWLVFPYSAT